MLKAFTPVAVLILSFFAGLEKPSKVQLLIVSFISIGAGLATFGELRFSSIGFAFQIAGIFVEALRLVLADQFLKSIKIDPLSTLYYLAPPSFVFLFIGFVLFEMDKFSPDLIMSSTLASILLINGAAAFCLNIASVLLITHTSAMVLVLGGIFKDIMLVILSVIVFKSPVSMLQVMGYSISLSAMNVYKEYKSNPVDFHNTLDRNISWMYSQLCMRGESAPSISSSSSINESQGENIELLTSEDASSDTNTV